MSPKIFLFILGLIALSCVIEAKSWTKKFQEKKFLPQTGEKAASLLRKRRDADAETSKSSEEDPGLLKFFIETLWESNKVDLLASLVEDLADSNTNLTLIGWQRVLNEDGSVKEINTVQLVIPPKPTNVKDSSEEDEDDDDDDDEEDEDPFSEIKEVFEPLAELGIPASITLEEFSKSGEKETLLYADKDEMYARIEGFGIYNKTVIVSQQEVDSIIKNLKPTILGKPTVLRYDVDGKFLAEQSNIQPYLLGTVTDHYEAPENVILSGPEIIARISQQYPHEEIAKQLGAEFNKRFSDYRWRVLVNPENYYVTRDVEVTLTYDNFGLDEGNEANYLVYGVKRSNVVTK